MCFGFIHRAQDAIQHLVADGVHLGLETEDGDVVAGVPHPYFVGFEYGFAVVALLAKQCIGEELAAIDGERGAGV